MLCRFPLTFVGQLCSVGQQIPIAIFELIFLKSEFFAAICEDFFSTFSVAGIGTHFGFDEELFEFHYYPPMFDMNCKTVMTLRLTMDNS